tara:strand:- start:1333 stop:1455 length:123 start_codon:yes stop_codon:yes gene_type:complete
MILSPLKLVALFVVYGRNISGKSKMKKSAIWDIRIAKMGL